MAELRTYAMPMNLYRYRPFSPIVGLIPSLVYGSVIAVERGRRRLGTGGAVL